MHVARSRARSMAVPLATVVVALAAAIAPPGAKAYTTPSWYYQEGTVGSSFSFVTPLDPLLSISTSGAGSSGDQSLSFQVTDAAVTGLAPTDQVTASATTSPIDLPMAQGPATLKDFLTLGGDLETVRDVSVAFSYNIDGRTSGGGLQWARAGAGGPGSFTLYLPAYTGGHTIAYKVQFTAPAAAMAAPVVLDDVTIGYGPYVKPPPGKKGDGGGTGHNKHKTGGDKGKPSTNTGQGSGSGAGSGSAAGNGSGTGGSGGSGGTGPTSANAGVGSKPATPTLHKSTATLPARAVTDAPVSSPATGGSAAVQGYAVVASAALGAGEATVANGAAGSGGGRSVGGGAGLGFSDTYLVARGDRRGSASAPDAHRRASPEARGGLRSRRRCRRLVWRRRALITPALPGLAGRRSRTARLDYAPPPASLTLPPRRDRPDATPPTRLPRRDSLDATTGLVACAATARRWSPRRGT